MAKTEAKPKKVTKAAAKPKVEKKAKKVKDPNAPKRGLSAFMFFSNAKRTEVKAKNPAYGIGDIAKEIGAMWKTISDKEKSKFEEMAAKDKERYEKEKAKYTKK